jgi:hypothetical protein
VGGRKEDGLKRRNVLKKNKPAATTCAGNGKAKRLKKVVSESHLQEKDFKFSHIFTDSRISIFSKKES